LLKQSLAVNVKDICKNYAKNFFSSKMLVFWGALLYVAEPMAFEYILILTIWDICKQ
jgi:hypothetical protein